jgi:pyruvate kinase
MWKASGLIRGQINFRHLSTKKTVTVPQLVKICATIGPASEQLPMLKQVVTAGMRIMRLNFSHATYEEADLRMTNLKLSPGVNNTKDNLNLRAVMLDTQGPEIRTGSFAGGVKEVTLELGNPLVVTIDEAFRNEQTTAKIWLSYKKLFDTVKEGACILLDDGAIEVC